MTVAHLPPLSPFAVWQIWNESKIYPLVIYICSLSCQAISALNSIPRVVLQALLLCQVFSVFSRNNFFFSKRMKLRKYNRNLRHLLKQQFRFWCKKSGSFTKSLKNIINGVFICHKQVNNGTKSNSYSLKRQQNYFCRDLLPY